MESLQPLSSVLLQPGSDNLNYETRRVRQGSRTDRRPSAGDRMIPQLPGRSFDLLAPTLLFLFFIAPAATGDPEILPKPRPGVICARNQSMKDFSICIFLFEGRKKNKIKKKKRFHHFCEALFFVNTQQPLRCCGVLRTGWLASVF